MITSPIELVLRPKPWEALNALQELDPAERTSAIQELHLQADERAAVLTQLDLREHAKAKLGEFARTMIFTRDGLEQATRLEVAAMHAARFIDAGVKSVADLGCGIGMDSLAMASLGLEVRAWDVDPQAVACTTVNLRFMQDATVNLGDVTQLDIAQLTKEGVQGIFADPARRTGAGGGARRITLPSQWSPSLETVLGWRGALASASFDALGVKVAPGLGYEHIPTDFEAHWISKDGSLLEAGLWSPDLQKQGAGRRATVLKPDGVFTFFEPGDPSQEPEQVAVATLGKYLWEPDPAIIRAGLIAKFVAESALDGPISHAIAYLTSNSLPDGDFLKVLSGFEVVQTTQLRPKAISKALRALEPTSVEVKKRGADIDPAALQTALKRILTPRSAHYENPLTVFATQIEGRHQAIIARRLKIVQDPQTV